MKHRITRWILPCLTAAALMLLIGQEQASASPLRTPSLPGMGQLFQAVSKPDAQAAGEVAQPDEDGEASNKAGISQKTIIKEKTKPEGELSGPEILANAQLISHAMGAIDGLTLLNCLESFQAQYEAGIRVFEVDLRLTRDVKMVLRHDWRGNWQPGINDASIPTREQFLSEKILEKYTPLSFRDLLLLMEQYPDICIITDTKFTEPDVYMIEFDSMAADAKELGLSYLFDRIIIQVYSKNMFTALNNAHHFPHYIYTLYNEGFAQTTAAFRDRALFCSQRGINGITMWDYWWNPSYEAIAEEYGVHVYVHTVNDVEQSKKLFSSGIDAIYTDSMVPSSFAPLSPDANAE